MQWPGCCDLVLRESVDYMYLGVTKPIRPESRQIFKISLAWHGLSKFRRLAAAWSGFKCEGLKIDSIEGSTSYGDRWQWFLSVYWFLGLLVVLNCTTTCISLYICRDFYIFTVIYRGWQDTWWLLLISRNELRRCWRRLARLLSAAPRHHFGWLRLGKFRLAAWVGGSQVYLKGSYILLWYLKGFF